MGGRSLFEMCYTNRHEAPRLKGDDYDNKDCRTSKGLRPVGGSNVTKEGIDLRASARRRERKSSFGESSRNRRIKNRPFENGSGWDAGLKILRPHGKNGRRPGKPFH